ncbi:MAG: hypothetical protein P4M14_03930 [Gammaproteobacteria bacterium]|nr:hypothetical protein [Gammaproteobacteria bacterium]
MPGSEQSRIEVARDIFSAVLNLKWATASAASASLAAQIFSACKDLTDETIRAIIHRSPAGLSSMINVFSVMDGGEDFLKTIADIYASGGFIDLNKKQLLSIAICAVVYTGGSIYSLSSFGNSNYILSSGYVATLANVASRSTKHLFNFFKSPTVKNKALAEPLIDSDEEDMEEQKDNKAGTQIQPKK